MLLAIVGNAMAISIGVKVPLNYFGAFYLAAFSDPDCSPLPLQIRVSGEMMNS